MRYLTIANGIVIHGAYKNRSWVIRQTNSGQLGSAVDYQLDVPGIFKSDYFRSLDKWSVDREIKQAQSFIDDACGVI